MVGHGRAGQAIASCRIRLVRLWTSKRTQARKLPQPKADTIRRDGADADAGLVGDATQLCAQVGWELEILRLGGDLRGLADGHHGGQVDHL